VRQTLNRVAFWLVLAPLFLISALIVPVGMEAWTSPGRFAIGVAWVAFTLMSALVIYDPRRFWLGMRVFAALMFAGLGALFLDQYLFSASPSTPALWHFLHFGLPSLAYAIWGPRGTKGDADASAAAKR